MVDLNGEPGTCEVCGRSMLAGERTRTYVTRDREERQVCDLCVVRAESADWIPRELAGTPAPERREAGGAVRRLFGRARESAATLSRTATAADDPGAAPEAARAEEASTPTRPRRRRQPPRRDPERREASQERRPVEGATPPAEAPTRRRSVPQRPERRIRRGFEHFNASEHRATVRSLIRSLGGPYVSAVTTDEDPSIVRVTVAWELSWYQYEVDLTAEAEPVRELGRGEELGQLSADDQAWNAHAAEDGELRTGLVGRRAED